MQIPNVAAVVASLLILNAWKELYKYGTKWAPEMFGYDVEDEDKEFNRKLNSLQCIALCEIRLCAPPFF